jgi:hypothetical protein
MQFDASSPELKAGAAEQMGRADQNHSSEGRHRKEGDARVDRDAQAKKDPLTQYGANQTQRNVSQNAVALAAHQLAGEPSRNETDDDRSEQMHSSPLSPDWCFRLAVYSMGGLSLLLLFHRRAATLESTATALGHNYLRATLAADVNFA